MATGSGDQRRAVVAQSREGLARLAAAIEKWREERGLERWEDVAALRGPSLATLRVIRNGTAGEISGYTRMRIARITGWERSYVDALLADEPLDLGELDPFEKSIVSSRLTPVQKRQIIDIWRSPGGREWLESLAQDRTGLARQA
jgi:hypothetical protein